MYGSSIFLARGLVMGGSWMDYLEWGSHGQVGLYCIAGLFGSCRCWEMER